ncbi:thymus-specific serine protease-like [Glandiceps talaboti]
MRLIAISLLLFCVLDVSNAILGTRFWKFREMVERQRREKALKQKQKWQNVIPLVGKPMFEFEAQFLMQPLEHFDPMVKDTYQQRYWVNPTYWNKPDGPVFLYIAGERGLGSYVVEIGEHVDLAKKYGALIVAVEHRFYGASINVDGLELKQMQYLSSQQALADLASFHSFAQSKFDLTEKNTWICFGGSYPGALSAWFRLKYPHLVYGAIASSAPVKAETNFEGYNEVVAASLADPVVKGSQECEANVASAFKEINQKIQEKQFDVLKKDFLSCNNISNPNDTATFVSNMASLLMGIVQYNEMTTWDIEQFCSYMTQPRKPYDNLAIFNAKYLNDSGEECSDNSFDNYLKLLRDTTSKSEGVGIRQWTYQTCTQFGYYQTCDSNTTCPFSPQMDLKSSLILCSAAFNISGSVVDRRVDFTNSYYGADHPSGTRIVFVNGSIDPWHALSVLQNLSPTVTAIFINGTAHCANMEEPTPQDLPSLVQARQKIDAQIGQWLQQARGQHENNKLYFKPQ